MSDYPDEPEGPDEINPAFLHKTVTAELLLRDPSSWTVEDDGTRTVNVPDARWLEWSGVPFLTYYTDCKHGFSVCTECMESWQQDYYLRLIENGVVTYITPDHPSQSDPTES